MAQPKTKAKKTTVVTTTAPKTATRAKAMPIVPMPFEGPFEAFATGTGHLLARGTFKAGLRDGLWTGGSHDGVHGWAHTYVAGVSDGPAKEMIEGRGKNGLCAEGHERDGKRVGVWTHYKDDGTSETSDYDAPEPGPNHGTITDTWPNGQVRRTATFVRGIRNGDEVRYFEDGTLAFQGSWMFDIPIGEHVEWSDGEEKRTTYVAGLPEAVAADTKALERTRKLYDKAKYVRSSDVCKGLETCRAASDDAHQLTDAWMLHLWRTLHVNISNEDAWEMFADVAPLISGREVMEMLTEIDLECGWGWPLPKWHGSLDRLVMSVYARDPEPIDAGWKKLSEPAKSGVAFVRARFGKDVGKTLERQLAAVASNRQSIGRVWWPQDDAGPREIELDVETALPPEAAQLRALFGTDDAWRTALLGALGTDDASSNATTHRLWIETATAAELVAHAHQLDGADWELIVTRWRHDDAAGLTTIALGIENAGEARDHLVALALVAHGAEGSQPPDALVDLLDLPADDLPTYSAPGDVRLATAKATQREDPLFHRALRALSPERIRRVIDRVMASDSWDRLRVGQYLYLVDDDQLVASYLDQLPCERVYWMTGIGEAGARYLPLLIERFDRQKKVKAKRCLGAGINIALARLAADGPFAAELDRYIDLTLDTERGFGAYLDRILCALPPERAEAILLAGFDTAFFAAFRRIMVCGTEAVLRTAFGKLVAQKRAQSELGSTIEPTIEALPDGENWWRWLHDAGATGAIHKESERQLGIGQFAD